MSLTRRPCPGYSRGALALAAGLGLAACGSEVPTPDFQRPNILLIVADDLGYTDLGAYGGDIRTPNIDALAARGLLFTQFHTAPMCAPTRAMLLSGNDNHVAGMGNQGGGSGPTEGLWGYEGHLSDRVVPFPALLQDAGYQTYMVGKWHLGATPEHSPTAAGFDRAFSILQGAGDHFSATALEPQDSVSTYWADGAFVDWPEGAYSTELYTDRLMGFMDDGFAAGDPFFAYAAYTSPHWPLQVPDEYLDRYAGAYDMGYDSLRVLRFVAQQEAGIVPEGWTLPPGMPPGVEGVRPWTSLTPDERVVESRKMELYAAMVENLDDHIGRLMAFLEERGELDNTLIFFLSDNGAAGEDFYNVGPYVEWVRRHWTNTLQTMGTAESYVSYGPPWALAGTAPFTGHKQHPTEGGITAPMIAAGPGINHTGALNRGWVGVQDLAPTILGIAGVHYPGTRGTEETLPMTGRSLAPVLSGREFRAHDASEVMALEHRNKAFVRQGRWKIVAQEQPLGPTTFRLYDMDNDPGETTDVSEAFPDQLRAMLGFWDAYRERNQVYVPESE